MMMIVMMMMMMTTTMMMMIGHNWVRWRPPSPGGVRTEFGQWLGRAAVKKLSFPHISFKRCHRWRGLFQFPEGCHQQRWDTLNFN